MTSKLKVAWHESKLIAPAERNVKLPKTILEKTNVSENLKSEPIKSDLYQSLFPIYHLSKICGLLPVRFSPIGGGLYSGKLYKSEILYGFLLVLFFISAQTWGLWRDLRHGWKNSTRLSSNTAVTVTCSDVVTIVGVFIVAILSSPFRWKHIQKSLNKLAEIDGKIGTVSSKSLQRIAIILVTCPLVFLIVISFLDHFTWLHSNKKKKLFPREDRGPINYSPIYVMYFVITVFEIQYALAALQIGERFERMNKILERLMKSYKIREYLKRDLRLDNQGIANGISLLITLHEDLCESTLFLNSGFGLPLFFATLSCLLHLIITPYFVYTEIQDVNCSWRVLCMQIIWILFHIMGLLITVQPGYWSTVQIAEAVTTYLVILIQFQDKDEDTISIKGAAEIINNKANSLKSSG